MASLDDFLRRGFFPKELLPPFTTSSFADALNSFGTAPDSDFKRTKCARFSHSKYASLRRDLSIPNPYQFCKLASLLAENWAEIEAPWNNSFYTRSAPVPSATRAIEGKTNFNELPNARAEIRSSGRFLLNADVSKCYHSIYTHSLPWALHSKPIAKTNCKWPPAGGMLSLVGNGLDLWSRNMQDGQTIGLPVGPDTSFVLAEALLSSVDQLIASKFANLRGFRFVDDYEFVCDTLEQAEKVLSVLQWALAEFELRLNPKKTSITELPTALDTTWVNAFCELEFAEGSQKFQRQLTRYFTDAFEMACKFPGDPVLKYATARLPNNPPDDAAANLSQRLSLQAACVDSGTLQFTLRSFWDHRAAGRDLDLRAMKRALDFIIQRHAPLGHSSEVAWCIWAADVFSVKLSADSAGCIGKMPDDVVALTALDGIQKGVFDTPPDIQSWTDIIDNSCMKEEHWLLIYEAIGQGWLTPSIGGDPATNDPFFNYLRSLDVKFYDISASLEIPEQTANIY